MSAPSMLWDRRQLLLAGMGAGFIPGCFDKVQRRVQISGDDSVLGHRLRSEKFPKAHQTEKIGALILGAGVAGCSAAYALEKKGFGDFLLLDMAKDPGGNARSGQNSISAFPLGAHYLPQPDRKQEDLLSFLEDAGALTGWSSKGEALYAEEYTCHDPEERVFYQGRWFENLIAWTALSKQEIADIRAFFAFVDRLRDKKGKDGRNVFRIPLDQSSRDSAFMSLDLMSFADFVRGQGWHSPYLAWYLNYCCRDDYGTRWDQVSAWAGLHYFTSRQGHGGGDVLTWPEGNAFLIRKLLKRSSERFLGHQLIHKVESHGAGYFVESFDVALGLSRRWQAEALIVALPRFIAQRLMPECSVTSGVMSYAPWMVANCTVEQLPESDGAALSWDNVPYGSDSLGYVVATHQNIKRYPGPSVLSSYWPLAGISSPLQRMMAGFRQAADWERLVLADFEAMHPGIHSSISSIDIWLWGHGMIQPKTGYIWGQARQAMNDQASKGLAFAHSDMSGISIFEEAFARGYGAARKILGETGSHAS